MTKPTRKRRRWVLGYGAAWLLAVLPQCAAGPQPAVQSTDSSVAGAAAEPAEVGTAPAHCGGQPCASGASVEAAPTQQPAPSAVQGPNRGSADPGLARRDGSPSDAELVLADEAYARGDYATAITHFEKAAQLATTDPAPLIGLLRSRWGASKLPTDFDGAREAQQRKQIQQLLDLAERALRLDPQFAPAHVESGRLLLVLGDASKALGSLRRAAELAPNDAEARSALGIALLATGASEQALPHFAKAAELEPGNSERLTNLGTAYMMRGRVAEATRAYRRAAELAPNDARAQGDLGTAYLAANRPDQALPYLRRAVRLAPERATFASNLGYAHQQLGQLEAAIRLYREALQKDPDLGSAWINLGTALAQKGQLDEAEQALKRAEAIDPTDPRVQANLRDLAELRRKQGSK